MIDWQPIETNRKDEDLDFLACNKNSECSPYSILRWDGSRFSDGECMEVEFTHWAELNLPDANPPQA